MPKPPTQASVDRYAELKKLDTASAEAQLKLRREENIGVGGPKSELSQKGAVLPKQSVSSSESKG